MEDTVVMQTHASQPRLLARLSHVQRMKQNADDLKWGQDNSDDGNNNGGNGDQKLTLMDFVEKFCSELGPRMIVRR